MRSSDSVGARWLFLVGLDDWLLYWSLSWEAALRVFASRGGFFVKRSHVLVLKALLFESPPEDSWQNAIDREWSFESLADFLNEKYCSGVSLADRVWSRHTVERAFKEFKRMRFTVYQGKRWITFKRRVVWYAHHHDGDPDWADILARLCSELGYSEDRSVRAKQVAADMKQLASAEVFELFGIQLHNDVGVGVLRGEE